MTDISNIISLHPTQPKWTLKRIEDERERSVNEILEAENKAINAKPKAMINAHEAELEKMWADYHADMADKIAAVKENTKNKMINAVKTVEREQRTDDAALRLVVKFKVRLSEEFGVTI